MEREKKEAGRTKEQKQREGRSNIFYVPAKNPSISAQFFKSTGIKHNILRTFVCVYKKSSGRSHA